MFKVADIVNGSGVNSNDLPHCLSVDINISCANCISMKEQLHNALLE